MGGAHVVGGGYEPVNVVAPADISAIVNRFSPIKPDSMESQGAWRFLSGRDAIEVHVAGKTVQIESVDFCIGRDRAAALESLSTAIANALGMCGDVKGKYACTLPKDHLGIADTEFHQHRFAPETTGALTGCATGIEWAVAQ